MKMLQTMIVVVAAVYSLMSCTSAETAVVREYLPAPAPVVSRKILQYPSYYKPLYHQYQPTYNPQYTSQQYPQYTNNGFLGSYQQQGLGQQITTGTTVGLPGVGWGGYYPSFGTDYATPLKPRVDVIDTVYDASGGYVYGKKK